MRLENLKKIPKNQILIGGLFGVLLLVIAIPVDSSKKNTKENDNTKEQEIVYEETQAGVYEKKMERRLETVLKSVEGVGKVEVMITLKDSGRSVVEKDRTISSQNAQDISESQSQEETVFVEQQGSGQQPFISQEVTPKVEGVLIVAEGGGNASVVKNISDAVLALFPVEIHKIKVVKMNL